MLFSQEGPRQLNASRSTTKPTYKAGLPACTQGAAGGMEAGLWVGRKVKTVSATIPPLKPLLNSDDIN